MKLCPKCQILKEEKEFPKRKSSKDGLYSYCKVCKSKDDKEYSKNNIEKLREHKRIYRKNNKDILNAKLRVYQKSEIGRKKFNEYRNVNREKVKEWNRNFYNRHKEERTLLNKEYKAKNKDRYRVYYLKNKTKRRNIIGTFGHISPNIIRELKEQQNNKCYYCLKELREFHVDHLIPVTKGGNHKEYNFVLACPNCNIKKSNKMPDEFLKKFWTLRKVI